MMDLYSALGIAPTAEQREIERAIAQHQLHKTLPDAVLQAAKQYLLNPQVRPRYNAKLFAQNPNIWEGLIVKQQQQIQDLQQQTHTPKTSLAQHRYAKPLLAVAAVMALATLAWAYYSPYYTLKQMQQALEQSDVDALSEHIDYPQLQYNVKSQLRQQIMASTQKLEGSSAMGMMMANMMINEVIDTFVTPEGLKKMTEQGNLLQAIETQATRKKVNIGQMQTSYRGVNEFFWCKPLSTKEKPNR